MKHIRVRFLFLFLSAIGAAQSPIRGLDPRKALTQYVLDSWQEESGLLKNSLLAIAQTPDGYLWLGTYENLIRFDGARFVSFDKSSIPGYNNTAVRALLVDQAGTLWIGSVGGLFSYREGRFTNHQRSAGLSDDNIYTLAPGSDSSLFVGTATGLFQYSHGLFTDRSDEFGVRGVGVWAVKEARDGTIWVGTEGSGLKRLAGSYLTSMTVQNGFPHNTVRSIIEDRAGNVWIGTAGGGIVGFSGGVFKTFSSKQGLGSDIVRVVAEDRNGNLWVGTSGGGLSRFRDGTFESLTSLLGLNNDVVWALHEDGEGSLWIGTGGGGLNRLKDSRFTNFTTKEGLSNNFVWTAFEDSKHRRWFGTNGGGLTMMSERGIRTYSTKDGLLSNIVRTIVEDRRGTLWIGSSLGLNAFDGKRFSAVALDAKAGSRQILSSKRTRDGTLWFGTEGDGLLHVVGANLYRFGPAQGLTSGTVRCLEEDASGALWVGTDGGLFKMSGQNKRMTRYGVEDGLPVNAIRSIYADDGDFLWIGTDGGGLVRYFNGAFTTYGAAQGLPAIVVHQVLEDGQGFLWMGCNKGILSVSELELQEVASHQRMTADFRLFTKADGMSSSECNGGNQPAGWKGADGRLWFPTIKGVVSLRPDLLYRNTIAPRVIAEEISLDSGEDVEGSLRTVPAGTERLTIHFTATSLFAPERVQFRYKLDGFDAMWSMPTFSRFATYTNIPPGEYRFLVVAANNDGVWNEQGASLPLSVQAYFYQTRAFQAFVLVFFLLSGTMFYRTRVQQLRRRQAELETMVQDRTQALQHALEDTQRQKELAEETNKLKSRLLHLAAHDLKSPLVSIRGLTQILEQESRDANASSVGAMVYGLANSMIALINGLLNDSAIESGKMAIVKQRIDLGQLSRSVVKSAEPVAAGKGQSILISGGAWGECHVEADEARMRDAVDNILSNAIKFSPRGKKIWVSVERRDAVVAVSIRDEGPGLTLEDQQKLFGKFQRLSARPTGGESSTGLGLSLAKEIVELHGGTVAVQSAPGQGSTFTIELPAAP